MALSKKVRFEVFKRDSFTCQYCGRSAPDVLLHIDHISPVSKGGEDDIMNLITSCVDCNLGKGARELDDDTVIAKQRRQLEELNERRVQLEMMLQWREELGEIKEASIDIISDNWSRLVEGYSLNDNGIRTARSYLRKYGLPEVLEAMEIATERYLQYDKEGKLTQESIEEAWKKIGGICHNRTLPKEEQEIMHLVQILWNRLYYCDRSLARLWLKRACDAGIALDYLKTVACSVGNWTTFRERMSELLEEDL